MAMGVFHLLLLAAVLTRSLSNGQRDELDWILSNGQPDELDWILSNGQPDECPENMEWSDCGSSCPTTCADVADMGRPQMCNMKCNIGCVCKRGYVLDANPSTCIPMKECLCKDNAHFAECGTNCPDTCEEDTFRACNKMCTMGCFCDEGYVLLQQSGTCVLPEDCSEETTD